MRCEIKIIALALGMFFANYGYCAGKSEVTVCATPLKGQEVKPECSTTCNTIKSTSDISSCLSKKNNLANLIAGINLKITNLNTIRTGQNYQAAKSAKVQAESQLNKAITDTNKQLADKNLDKTLREQIIARKKSLDDKNSNAPEKVNFNAANAALDALQDGPINEIWNLETQAEGVVQEIKELGGKPAELPPRQKKD